jgi:predicted transglutaminase-like cysteine proteinase
MPTSVPVVPRETSVFLSPLRLPIWVVWLTLWLAGVVLLAAGWAAVILSLTLLSAPANAAPALNTGEYTLGPMAHAMFCLHYPKECEVAEPLILRVQLTQAHEAELLQVNADANRAISPERNTRGLAGEIWLIWPARGECHDYAVTKRHELMRLGWPASTLLLAEVVVPDGEHHLVLVVKTDKGDIVLDNLRGNITPWERLPYLWVRIQSPENPRYWRSVNLALR